MALTDAALVAAAVSASVTALGWFATNWSEKNLESLRRAERVIDVQTALLAEIESNLKRYEEINLDKHNAEMIRLIKGSKGRGRFTPFVPRYPSEIVFEAMISDIHILPTKTIDEVVAYYKQEYKLRELVEDLRADHYRELENERKAQLYDHYVWQIKTVLITGSEARNALRASLRLKPQPPVISNPASGLSPASGNL
jgi:hypothetical protein